jgi:DNA polymerase III subunit delta'
MASETASEPDRLEDAPHPREQLALFGHEAAERAFLDAVESGRLHHAWLIGGPEGVGKATLAYRMARFLLARRAGAPARTLEVPKDHPVPRLIAAQSHPNLAVLRRAAATDKKAASTTIPVDAVRKAMGLFASTAADGGYRVCIVDSADDLIAASANALLKMVEEPPPRSIFLIVAHAPQRLLPTIRSRCRRLALRPLAAEDVRRAVSSLGPPWTQAPSEALEDAIAMGEGSVRRTLEMLDEDKIRVVRNVSAALRALPQVDAKAVLSLSETLARKDGEEAYALALDTVLRWAGDELRHKAALGAARLAPLAEACEKVARAAQEADEYNLDRRPLVISMFDDLARAVLRTQA